MSDTTRPSKSDNKATWADHVRSLDPHGNQGDPDGMTKDELMVLAEQLEAQGVPGSVTTEPVATRTAGTEQAGETRTAVATGSGDARYDTRTAGPSEQPPTRTSTQRSETSSAVTDRTPEEAERLAAEQTPATSERIMGLPDSPSAAETGQGH